jgi:hypothetical protein
MPWRPHLPGTAASWRHKAHCKSIFQMRDVRSILDAHYLHRDPALAESAIKKLERRTESPK